MTKIIESYNKTIMKKYVEQFYAFCIELFSIIIIVIQSTLVISNSKGLSEIHRDIRTLTYQVSRIEEKNLTNKYPKFIGNLTPLH